MSNRVTIEPTQFVNVRSGETSLGVRVYDDEGCFYDNSWEGIPDDDLEVLRNTLERATDDMLMMFEFVRESKRGLYIGGVWYEWEAVRSVFEDFD